MIERLMDLAADELGIDPVELRRRNLLRSDDFPHATHTGALYDSGDYEATLDPQAKGMLDHALSCAIVGSPATVRSGLADFVRRTGADELMVTAQVFDHRARLKSFEILADAHRELSQAA